MTSVNGKYVLRIWVYSTVLNEMKPQLCFFLKKPSLILVTRGRFGWRPNPEVQYDSGQAITALLVQASIQIFVIPNTNH